MGRNYWMISESQENFEITKSLGFTLHGLGPRHRRRADRMQPDDRMLYYVKGLRKWTASLIITSRSFEGRDPIWVSSRKGNGYPYRVQVAPDIVLDAEDYIDALVLAPRLEYVKRWAPEDWPLAFFDRLHLLPQRDFRLIEGEMKRNISQRRRSSKGPSRGSRSGRRSRGQRRERAGAQAAGPPAQGYRQGREARVAAHVGEEEQRREGEGHPSAPTEGPDQALVQDPNPRG